MTNEEYERLRAPLLKALAEAAEQYRLNTAPIYDQLLRLSAMMPMRPVFIMESDITPEVLAELNKPARGALIPYNPEYNPTGNWTTPAVPDALGLTQAELACAGIDLVCKCDMVDGECHLHAPEPASISIRHGHPFCGYDTGCPFCG